MGGNYTNLLFLLLIELFLFVNYSNKIIYYLSALYRYIFLPFFLKCGTNISVLNSLDRFVGLESNNIYSRSGSLFLKILVLGPQGVPLD